MTTMKFYAPDTKVANSFPNQIHFILLKWSPKARDKKSQPIGQTSLLVGHTMALSEFIIFF